MKINYYEAFELIADEAIELLADHDGNDEIAKRYLPEITIQTIVKKKQKKITWSKRFLIAAVIIMLVSSISFALSEEGAELITKLNSYMAGQEGKAVASVYDQNGNLISGPLRKELTEDVWKTGSVIRSSENDNCLPGSITEFQVDEVNGRFVTPAIIFWNSDMVIFTKKDGSGWKLKKGETLQFKAEEYASKINDGEGQTIDYGYVWNNCLRGKAFTMCGEIQQKYEITAEEEGEYYICMINYTSDPISLKRGVIRKK